jgi:hypothetical protein
MEILWLAGTLLLAAGLKVGLGVTRLYAAVATALLT